MSKWLDRALAAVAADRPSDPKMSNTLSAVSTFSADRSTAKGISADTTTERRPKGTKGANGTKGIRQKQSDSPFDGLPRYWVKAFAALAATPCPSYVAPERWQQLLADADQLRRWAPMLAAMGWTLPDVLGRARIDHMSLVWLMQGQRVCAVTSIATVLRGTDGLTTYIYRRGP